MTRLCCLHARSRLLAWAAALYGCNPAKEREVAMIILLLLSVSLFVSVTLPLFSTYTTIICIAIVQCIAKKPLFKYVCTLLCIANWCWVLEKVLAFFFLLVLLSISGQVPFDLRGLLYSWLLCSCGISWTAALYAEDALIIICSLFVCLKSFSAFSWQMMSSSQGRMIASLTAAP